MVERDSDDSDAPEEVSVQQGLKQVESLQKAERESKTRIAQEGKERRRRWAQRKTPRKSKDDEVVKELTETEPQQEDERNLGTLPTDIVNLLVARDNQVFLSDSEEENASENKKRRKKKPKTFGPDLVILKDIGSAKCLENSLDFLKKKKMQVSRSSSVLKNSSQALRLISFQGHLQE
ncbi:hypothetical protein MKW94_005920 [Papaver nudicaule]|uniref:Uncharacterized protein n=1 Tax=Papaver nudicaule TaxID=74823 RepID=A0AA41UVC2_PAPNU|nr:hypothetical protein [Papaver nudicaule]